jgi:hypothetical protein
MGWFHDTFGFSSQPAVEVLSDAAGGLWDLATQTGGNLVEGITGSEKLGNAIRPPSWEEMGNPGEAFYTSVNDINKYVPTDAGRQYAPAVEGMVLSAINPMAGAAFNTAYNAGNMQANQKGMDWGEVGKDALINFGSAAASMAADKIASNARAAQSVKAPAAPGSLQEGFNASKYGANAPAVGSNFGADALSNYGTNALSGFGSSVEAAAALPRLNSAAAARSAGRGVPSMLDTAYNASVQGAPQLANQALTSTLAPKTAPISGMEAGSPSASSGSIYQPSGSDIFRAFGGDAVNSTDMITEEQYRQMQQNLGLNAGAQTNTVRDMMLPAGQTLPEPNTPYSNQLENIGQSYGQGTVDLANQVNSENYNRYNARLFQGLSEANPGLLDQATFDSWLANRESIPPQLLDLFQPAPTMMSL